jgi:hypothetical protein
MSNGIGAGGTPTVADYYYSAQARPVNVAIDPVALIITECITVTSAMRKHARWAQSSVSAILGGGATRRPPSALASLGAAAAAADDADGTTRWGLRGKKGKSIQDNPLLSAFARLRSQLKGCRGVLFHFLFLSPTFQSRQTNQNRCPYRRHAIHPPAFPTGHPLLFHHRPHHLPGSNSHHQNALIQCHRPGHAQLCLRHDASVVQRDKLQVRG